MTKPLEIDNVSEVDLRREKEKARTLRRTHWWDKKIQKGICYYCHRKVGRGQLTMDHLVPLSRGGKSRKGKLNNTLGNTLYNVSLSLFGTAPRYQKNRDMRSRT
jgi:hypothetical protein